MDQRNDMRIGDITGYLETIAPPAYQEDYDNAGLITGSQLWLCYGAMICLDVTDAVIREAIERHCNLVIAHHPVIFRGLKKITPDDYAGKAVTAAIKNDIAIYAIHTNLDNVIDGVSGKMAGLLGLVNRRVLLPKAGTLKKLFTFVPVKHAGQVRDAIFDAGGGRIGHYSECSFATEGTGSFTAGEGTNPYVGKTGERHYEQELKLEVIFPAYLERRLVQAMKAAHPYEEVAFDVVELANSHPGVGAGIIGDLPVPVDEKDFLHTIKAQFNLQVIRHTALPGKPLSKIALCGGAGSSLIARALALQADIFITADVKYHDFFEANGRMVIADIGHYESEQYTIDLLYDLLKNKFSNFALLKTECNTNPVHYFQG